MARSNCSLLLRCFSRNISSPLSSLLLCVGLACLPGCGDEEPADSEPSTDSDAAIDVDEDAVDDTSPSADTADTAPSADTADTAPSPDTADTAPSSDAADGGEQDTLEDPEEDAPDADTGLAATSVVGPSGATLTLESGVSLTIPAGALDAEIEVQIREIGPATVPALEGLDLFSPAIALLPHGTTFNAPVTLTLPYEGFDGFGGFAMRLDDELDLDFEAVEVAAYGEFSVTLELESFSIYLTQTGCGLLCDQAVDLCPDGGPSVRDCKDDCQSRGAFENQGAANACGQYASDLLACYQAGLEASSINCETGALSLSGCSELETSAATCNTCFVEGSRSPADAESCTVCASFGYTTPDELAECRDICLDSAEHMAACNACDALVDNLSTLDTTYTLVNLELCVDRYINYCHRDGVPFWDPIFDGSPPDPDAGLALCLQCGPSDDDADGCPNLCDFSDQNAYCIGPLGCQSTIVEPAIVFALYDAPDTDPCAAPDAIGERFCPGDFCDETCAVPCDDPRQDGYFEFQSCNCSTPICDCNSADCLTALGEQCVPGFP